jgi:S-formylglutathione hydrolase FrmB
MTAATQPAVAVSAHDLMSRANARRFTVWSWRPEGEGPFPLLVLLHGVYDSGGHGWWLRARVDAQVSALARSGELAVPPVILMPSDTGAEFGSAYADWADGTTRAETFVADELLRWAAEEFPLDGRRWVSGLSMGGYGALLLALRAPGRFASATSTSGFFRTARTSARASGVTRPGAPATTWRRCCAIATAARRSGSHSTAAPTTTISPRTASCTGC